MSFPCHIRLTTVAPVPARVTLPGSKSITNRAYVLAALADGVSTLSGALHSDDTDAMTGCLGLLHVDVSQDQPGLTRVVGSRGNFSAPDAPLFVKNSGTTIRFLTAAASLIPGGASVVLDGIARMRQRPILHLVDTLNQLGVSAWTSENGCPPVTVKGGGIAGGRCVIKGSMSSQYLSSVLMISPYASADTEIIVDGDLVSKPYVDMTIAMMAEFGVKVENDRYKSFFIPSSQKYRGREYNIEPDASNASYFLAAAAVTGGTVTVDRIGTTSIQGDVAFVDVLEKMGCTVTKSADSITVTGPEMLSAVNFDATMIPDMAQTLAVVACFANGVSHFTGLKTLRVKETDRISAMATEMRKIGADVTEGPDYLIVSPPVRVISAAIDTYDDHRMAMSFAIAGLRIDGLIINDPGCVQKTFPDFWDRWSGAFPGSIADKDLQ